MKQKGQKANTAHSPPQLLQRWNPHHPLLTKGEKNEFESFVLKVLHTFDYLRQALTKISYIGCFKQIL